MSQLPPGTGLKRTLTITFETYHKIPTMDEVQSAYLKYAFENSGRSKTKTAKAIKLARATTYRWLRRYGIID